MKMRNYWRLVVSSALILSTSLIGSGAASAAGSSGRPDLTEVDLPGQASLATFEGRTIDMSQDWGQATACVVPADQAAQCFRTEKEADRWATELDSAAEAARATRNSSGVVAAASAGCGTRLSLYKGTNYSSTALYLYSRTGWKNLADYGFNQSVSSFKVGACDVRFADLSNGGGAWYPAWLSEAWDTQSSLSATWNNDFSSVRIY